MQLGASGPALIKARRRRWEDSAPPGEGADDAVTSRDASAELSLFRRLRIPFLAGLRGRIRRMRTRIIAVAAVLCLLRLAVWVVRAALAGGFQEQERANYADYLYRKGKEEAFLKALMAEAERRKLKQQRGPA
ncbi:hypothetical protein JIQ42_06076 [Leishmania sp. Namibia]|uniref:hypothetical protein n=1 Tax=Leishmania sp. Namibia TaxID=2802991 RepID=UPI001B4A6C85|nr:hypothetical protein JIQ42_06076 [Leishmania sp. Namibia]